MRERRSQAGRRPKWPLTRTLAAAKGTLELLEQHTARLEKRLGAGANGRIRQLICELEEKHQESANASVGKEAATRAQNQALEQAYDFVSYMRAAVNRSPAATPAVKKAFGVGERVAPKKVFSVANALGVVLKAAADHPAEAALAGILPEDLAEGRQLHHRLITTDEYQEGAKKLAVTMRALRDQARLSLEDALDRIIAAAFVEFRREPALAAQYASLIPGKSRKPQRAPRV